MTKKGHGNRLKKVLKRYKKDGCRRPSRVKHSSDLQADCVICIECSELKPEASCRSPTECTHKQGTSDASSRLSLSHCHNMSVRTWSRLNKADRWTFRPTPSSVLISPHWWTFCWSFSFAKAAIPLISLL
jgi:hypothetical protein